MSLFCHSRIQWFLTVAGLLGVASVFLDFAYGVSPFEASLWGFTNDIFHEFWTLGAPALLALFVSAFVIRWNLSGRLSLPELIITYLLSFLGLGILIMTNFKLMIAVFDYFTKPNYAISSETIPMLVFSIISLIAGILLVIRNSRVGKFKNLSPIMLMQTICISDVIFCLICFWGNWQIGAYFAILAVIVYIAQMIWISSQKKETVPINFQEL